MSKSSGKLVIPAIVVLCLLLVGAGYAMGRKNVNPFRAKLAQAETDSTALAKSTYKRCGKLTGEAKIDCYSKTLDSLASKGEVKVAMATLLRLADLDVDAKRDGHVYAHGIGIAAGKAGGDVAKTFAMCDESNQSGCYHGVIQAYFDATKTIGPSEVNSLCDPFRGPQGDRWLRFQCVHGMGHGLEMIYAHNLPKALTACDLLSDDWDRRSCYGGAFMENIVNATMPHHPSHGLGSHSEMNMAGMDHAGMDHAGMNHEPEKPFKAIDPKDPHYPCSIMAEQYLVSCYEMQTSIMLYLNQGNMASAAKSCDKAPGGMKYVCYQSLGRDISSYSLQNHATAIRMCSQGTKKYQPWCYIGLVKNFIDLNAKADDGLRLCRELTEQRSKMKCYEAVGEEIGTIRNDTESRRKMCAPSEPTYLDACLYGARVTTEMPALLKAMAVESSS
jgi:hypothetical protein